MKFRAVSVFLLSGGLVAACLSSAPKEISVGMLVQRDLRVPTPWHELSEDEQRRFDMGHAVFNTGWSPANKPPGRRDGLGPIFNSQSCDSCHNSRRRGRGPRGNGVAPGNLVIQLGKRLDDGSVVRGTDEYGFILNTSSVEGATDEASVSIEYTYKDFVLADGTDIPLYTPYYKLDDFSGDKLPPSTVLMPRMPSAIFGVGLLESVPKTTIVTIASEQTQQGRVSGRVSHVGDQIGRFGWQATEPTVASQTAAALSREMGLTTTLISHADCGRRNRVCDSTAAAAPEVEPELFNALVEFQRLHAVPIGAVRSTTAVGSLIFRDLGCADCHRPSLKISAGKEIHPFTDLLLHDLGQDLDDRDISGRTVHSEWRTAPLWGLNASVQSGQPLRLLHDGRARSIEEAILWHSGTAEKVRDAYALLP
ncbi:MAG TPA: di-heme oxidoredictase family protein, partial [Steroidobacteraceae bacterium]|nr:di-heme oxidoredictase family protein [Steroidobacteraceae bacterium]